MLSLFYRLNVRDYTIWCAICLEVVGYYGEDKGKDNEVKDGKDRNDRDEDDKGEDDEVG